MAMCDDCSERCTDGHGDDVDDSVKGAMHELTAVQKTDELTWDAIMTDPKAIRLHQARTFRTTTYETLHNNGFLRLCTSRVSAE